MAPVRSVAGPFALLALLLLAVSARAHTTGEHVDHIEADRQAALAAQTFTAFEAPQQPPIPAVQRQQLGEWSQVVSWPHIPVSAAILLDGRILTWASNERDAFPGGRPEFTYAATWDPLDGSFIDVPHGSHDMFCAHQVALGDGRIFVNGGRNTVRTTSVFDPDTNSWTVIDPMNRPRWYPTSVFLSDGGVFTALGSGGGPNPELWREGAGWRLLTGIDFTNRALNYGGHYEQLWWPFFVQTPFGDLFHYGPTPTMHRLDLRGAGSVQDLGVLNEDWYPKHGISALYDRGAVLVAGGAIAGNDQGSTDRAMVIDVNGFAPAVRPVAPMHHPRKFHNAVLLPNGEVLVVGGNTSGIKFNDAGTVLPAEVWNPLTETWRELAPMSVPRNYHSIALLLTDGRILAAGGGLCGSCAANHQDGQVYSPGYLFAPDGSPAVRPVINGAPQIADLGAVVPVDGDAGIARFTLVRTSTTTHAVNTDQRFLEVPFTETSAGNYELELEANPHVLPPGIYMLFALSNTGVPAIARMIRIRHPDAGEPTGPRWRYFRLVALSELAGQPWTSVAELDLLDGNGTALPSTGWTVTADSEETASEDGSAVNAIDGDVNTIWHTEWSAANPPHPHELVIDLGAETSLGGFAYTPRQIGTNGRIGDYEAYVSADGVSWGLPVAVGTFPSSGDVQTVLFGSLSGSGLSYAYYEGSWSALPDFDALTPVAVGHVANVDIEPRLRDDDFGFRFIGRIRIDVPGTYTFYTESDDGSQLFIDGALVVDNDGLHAPREEEGSLFLAAGEHDFDLRFFERGGGELLVASFSGPGVAKQSIPASRFGALPVGANLAPAGTPSQSSTLSGATADRATDGNTDGDYANGSVAHTAGGEAQPWWEIDLGAVHPLDSIRLWNRTDCCSDRLANFHVFVSEDPFASTDLAATQAQAGVLDVPYPGVADDDTLIPIRSAGRYVRVQLEGAGPLQLAEVEILLGVATAPDPLSVSLDPTPAVPVGTAAVFSVTLTGGDDPMVSWDFGDGSPPTAPSPDPGTSHSYAQPGRYLGQVTVTDEQGALETRSFVRHVHDPITPARPDHSTPIRFLPRAGGDLVVNVNPDNDLLTWHDAADLTPLGAVTVGRDPRALAVAPDGRVWTADKGDATLSVIDLDTGVRVATHALPASSQPHGLLFAPDGSRLYVALEGTGQLLALDPADASVLATLDVGAHVRHLSIAASGAPLYATRFVTPKLPGEDTLSPQTEVGGFAFGGEMLVIDPVGLTLANRIVLHHHDAVDAQNEARGIPNYLGPAVVSPDGLTAWVPSKQDNILRGSGRDGLPLTHDSTVRAVTSHVDLTLEQEIEADRVDHDDSGLASAAAFGPTGNLLYVALETTRQVAVVDAYAGTELARISVDRAPQGVALSPDGLALYTHNFMERSVTRHDLSGFVLANASALPRTHTAVTVASERLAADVLLGKQLFYDAEDSRLALEGYVSCASCHHAGAGDGRVWDFTGFGEGLRNTVDLRGHGGPEHGPLHWSGNFDEIQDFEGQIRAFALGTGLMSDGDFHTGTRALPLGDPKAGLSADLDALAAYVASLDAAPPSPYRNASGTLTESARRGLTQFRAHGCTQCHGGAAFTDSAVDVRHDVGTLKPASGQRLGGVLDGLDTPTLLGSWATGPYLHDGSADTLDEAIAAHTNHWVPPAERADIAAYLRELDAPAATPRCGLGAELVLILAPLAVLRRRMTR